MVSDPIGSIGLKIRSEFPAREPTSGYYWDSRLICQTGSQLRSRFLISAKA